jgi:hypothetical protein
MRPNRIEKIICQVIVLSLVGTWFHVSTIQAEEIQQTPTEQIKEIDSSQELPEKPTSTTQEEQASEKSERQRGESKTLEDYIPNPYLRGLVQFPLATVGILLCGTLYTAYLIYVVGEQTVKRITGIVKQKAIKEESK